MTSSLPTWWSPLLQRVAESRTHDFSRLPVPADGGRPSAVLILLGEAAPGQPDVVILERAADMRHHAGQPAFPGGAADPGDRDAAATALREAYEEIGLDPDSVDVLATLPPLWIPVSRFVVTPVLAWWRREHPVAPRDPAEVARVERVPVAELTDPANRIRLRHPSGYVGSAFRVRQMLVWGFTAGVLDALLTMAGWSQPWSERAAPVELPVAGDRPVP
ncbi:MAG TPA: CoA pyrophosphatase [Rugosimonospora sp.]|nr:CoA pyrophosphatase [Rugosimonospora sp.]